MASVLSKPKAAPVPIPQPVEKAPEVPTIDKAKEAQQNQDEIDRKRGRASTILTSSAGDTTAPKLGASTALGY